MEEQEETPLSQSCHESGEHAISLSGRLAGNIEEKLEDRILLKAARDVELEDRSVRNPVIPNRLQHHV